LLLSPSSSFAQAENVQFIFDMLGHISKLYLDEFFLLDNGYSHRNMGSDLTCKQEGKKERKKEKELMNQTGWPQCITYQQLLHF